MDLQNGSGRSERSESQPQIIDGRDHCEPYPKLRVRIASSDHLDVRPEIIDESGSSKQSNSPPKVVDDSDSSQHTKSKQNASCNEGVPLIPAVKVGSSSSSHSSSSASSLEDLIPVKTNEGLGSNMLSTCLDGADKDTQQKLKGHETDISSNSFSNSEESENGLPCPTGTSPVSDITHESRIHMQSPAVQVMERTSGYDPHRIPSIIFERPTTPMDWSAASNDSLFSIHVGNSSFSKDSLFMPGDELTKSGELIVFSPPPPHAAMHKDTKSSIPALGTGQQPVKTENVEAVGVAGVNIEDAKREAGGNPTEERNPAPSVSWKSTATASHSDESRDSVASFAFPIRKKKCEWPSCYCSNCSRAFCYCAWLRWPSCCFSWPRCHFRWPSSCVSNCSWAFCCSNCNWAFCGCPKCSHSLAFCYCWNCSQKRCCHSSPNLADGMRSSSAKASDEEQQLQPSAVSANKRSASCCCMHRCHRISCWPWGCCTNHCHCC